MSGDRDTGEGRAHSGQHPDIVGLSQRILYCANRSLSRTDFLQEVSRVVMDFSGCDAVEMRLRQEDFHYRWTAARRPEQTTHLEMVRWASEDDGRVLPVLRHNSDLETICRHVSLQRPIPGQQFFTENGSFWTPDAWEPLRPANPGYASGPAAPLCIGGHYRSLAVIRFLVDETTTGLLLVKAERPSSFTEEAVKFLEGAAQTIGLAAADWRAKRALTERVKELTCLYGIAQVAEESPDSLEERLARIVALLPSAWQYPEIAAAEISLDSRTYATRSIVAGPYEQSDDILVQDAPRGRVRVVYMEDRPEFTAGAFLPEEEKLIAAVAREVGLIIERQEAEEERSSLQQQLIHADRLATIGQLAAGVAHELNEPLGSILGFAQLAKKNPQLPPQVDRDIEKVITASLYAREVIRKLMVFARQVPARNEKVDLTQIVEDTLYFLEDRCTKSGVVILRELARDLPVISADPAQIKQVLVNLVVNAVQAMPHGGRLIIGTRRSGGDVEMSVEDTGAGIAPEIVEQIFLPFFTTKDINEGTGLGLAVVHGIVTAHGGTIGVSSQSGHGSCFRVHLPGIEPENV